MWVYYQMLYPSVISIISIIDSVIALKYWVDIIKSYKEN